MSLHLLWCLDGNPSNPLHRIYGQDGVRFTASLHKFIQKWRTNFSPEYHFGLHGVKFGHHSYLNFSKTSHGVAILGLSGLKGHFSGLS